MYKFGKRSEFMLVGVEDGLVEVARGAIAICRVDFCVFEGMRTPERQQALFDAGKSKTLKSRHLTGDALDLVPIKDGVLVWQDLDAYRAIAEAMYLAADQRGHLIQSGSDWNLNGITTDETFADWPHWQNPFPYRVKEATDAAAKRVAHRLEEDDLRKLADTRSRSSE